MAAASVFGDTAQSKVDSLMKARCVLIKEHPFYGHMSMLMDWIESDWAWEPNEEARTMGVCVKDDMRVQCIYYPPFVASLNPLELMAIIQHEIEHLIRMHCIRTTAQDHKIHNIAADMAVNGKRDNPKIGMSEDNSRSPVIPFKDMIVWCPPALSDTLSVDEYYAYIMKDIKSAPCTCKVDFQLSGGVGKDDDNGKGGEGEEGGEGEQEGKGGGEGEESKDGSGGSGNKKGKGKGKENKGEGCPRHGKYGKMLDNHDIWDQSDVCPDQARQMIYDMVQNAADKSQGHTPGHITEILKQLGKPIVHWRQLLRQYIGRHIGSRRKTFSRASRRHTSFGMPGFSRHAASSVNVIIDTSGSVGKAELEQFFAEIDMIASRSKVHILQWDHAFQGYGIYRRGMWKDFKVNGRGGTDMAAPIYWLDDNKVVADCQIMLTDGYCNWATQKPFPLITCITTKDTSEPSWGHVVRIDVAK